MFSEIYLQIDVSFPFNIINLHFFFRDAEQMRLKQQKALEKQQQMQQQKAR